MHTTKEIDELKAAADQASLPMAGGRSDAVPADALNVTSRCSASVTLARPLLLDTGAFGALLACGFDEEVRIYKLSDAGRVQRSDADWPSGNSADAGGGGYVWRWPHWQRLAGVHRSIVRDIQPAMDSEVRLVTCGEDGRLAVWNYPAGQAVLVFEFGMPLLRVIALPAGNSADDPDGVAKSRTAYYCLYMNRKKYQQQSDSSGSEPDYRVAVFTGQSAGRGRFDRTLMRHVQPDCLSVGQAGRFLISANAGNLLVYRSSKQKIYSHCACDGGKCRVVSMAAHPTQRSAAVGLSDGRVLIMHGLFTTARPVSTLLQWHFRPVSGLSFSPDGCALYSGGQEAVLVKWDTSPEAGSEGAGSRAFLPRLGARIVGTVSGPNGGAAVAVVLADNSVLVADSNLGLVGGLNGGVLVGEDIDEGDNSKSALRQVGLLRDPLTECVAMSGQAGVLQFYSVSGQRHLGCLDVAKANYTAVESSVVAKVTSARIELAAFSDDGAWLATFDRRDDGRYAPELRLRLWQRRCPRPLVKGECGGDFDAVWERLAFSQCGEERLTDRLVGMAFQPCAGERKFVGAFADGSLACWTREERVQHLAEPDRPADFTSHWTITRTWRLGLGFTGGPLTFDPTGRYLLTCHQSQACSAAWHTTDLASPPALFRLYDLPAKSSNPTSESAGLSFCSMWDSGRSVVLCGRDRVRVWDRASGRRLTEARLAVTSAVEDYKSGMLILLCSTEQALLMLHSCEPGQLSRIKLNCPSEPLDICVTEDTFVFLTRDRRLFVYPEPASSSVDIRDDALDGAPTATSMAIAELEAESAAAASLLGRVFGRRADRASSLLTRGPDAAAALEARLRLFAESDAFAAPNLARFVASNLQLLRLNLLAKEAADAADEAAQLDLGEGDVESGYYSGKKSAKIHDTSEEADSDGTDDIAQPGPAAAAQPAETRLPPATFDRLLCRCLVRLSSGSGRLTSMRRLQRIRRQNKRRQQRAVARAASAATSAAAAALAASARAAAVSEALPEPTVTSTEVTDQLNETGDSESDLIIVSTTKATTPKKFVDDCDDDDADEDNESTRKRRPPKRRANGELAVDLDEESSCSGHSSIKKKRQRRKLSNN